MLTARASGRRIAQCALSSLPDLDSALAALDDVPSLVASMVSRNAPPGEEARAGLAADQAAASLTDHLRSGRAALTKVHAEGVGTALTAPEQLGLEAVVLSVGRPAILVQDDHFFPPPAGWEVLEQHRPAVEQVLRSVGRIEVTGHPSLDWIGTCFLVDEDVVLTNRHVVQDFLDLSQTARWRVDPRMRVRVDFAEELGSTVAREFPVTEIVGIHQTLDLALLRIDPTAGTAPAPPPLTLARDVAIEPDQLVYVVGYPAADSRRNFEADIASIFSQIFNVKRLQPGRVLSVTSPWEFGHDCSTLGGNSGSCVVDLSSSTVLGVHSRGRYLVSNFAVTTQTLVEALHAAGV